MRLFVLSILLAGCCSLSGEFSPQAGVDGSHAVSKSDPRIIRWADKVESYQPGEDVDQVWQDTTQALGPAEGTAEDVISLGRGGEIVLSFDVPIRDNPGPDFAIFENGFGSGDRAFLELAYVEVSLDGVSFFRFPNDSLVSQPVGAFGSTMNAEDLSGFAGSMIAGYGTPFDLSDVIASTDFNSDEIRFIRLVDIVGGVSLDTSGDVIYDPFPTLISSGFDLDAIGVIEGAVPLNSGIEDGKFYVSWTTSVERSEGLSLERSEDGFNFDVVDPNTVQAQVTGESAEMRYTTQFAAGSHFYRLRWR